MDTRKFKSICFHKINAIQILIFIECVIQMECVVILLNIASGLNKVSGWISVSAKMPCINLLRSVSESKHPNGHKAGSHLI